MTNSNLNWRAFLCAGTTSSEEPKPEEQPEPPQEEQEEKPAAAEAKPECKEVPKAEEATDDGEMVCLRRCALPNTLFFSSSKRNVYLVGFLSGPYMFSIEF